MRLPFGRAAAAGRRTQINEPAAADRALGRRVADDIAILLRGGDRPVQHQLDIGRRARLERFVSEQDDMRSDLDRRVMQPHRKPLTDRLRLARQQAQLGIDAGRRGVQFGIEHDVAALDYLLGNGFADQIEGAALSRPPDLRVAVLGVQRADPRRADRRG